MIKLKSFPLAIPQLLMPLGIILIALIAYIFDENAHQVFNYQQDLIEQGQWWRIITGHFFHTNGYHLLLNLAGIVLLWSLHGHFYQSKSYLFVFVISALMCSVGIYYFSDDISIYVGLSGVLHGIFVWGALMDIINKEKTGYILFIGVWLKVLHEQVYGASDDVAQLIAANVAIDAHLWGAIGGLLAAIYLLVATKNHTQKAAH